MKRLFLILSLISCLSLSGCSNGEVAEEPEQIPETLVVNADLPRDVPAKASTYKVSYMNFDSDVLLEIFNMKSDSFTERDAIGKRFKSDDSLLIVYDDDGVLYGGFSYSKELPSSVDFAVSLYRDAKLSEEKATSNFEDIEALSFFKDIGMKELKANRVYDISGEELIETVKSSEENKDWDTSDIDPEETYSLVYLSQLIDGIPLTDIPWGIHGGDQTNTGAEAIICENQMISGDFNNLYHVEQELSNDKMISPEQALNAFVKDYNKKIQSETTTITNISFNYVVTCDKDGMYAQPAYIFEYEYGDEVVIKEDKTISARTGEFILSTEVGI